MLVDHKKAFLDDLEDQFNAVAKDGVYPLRKQAWDRLQEIGLPSNKMGAFQYCPLVRFYGASFEETDFPTLSKQDFDRYILPESKEACIVLVNGAFYPELSRLEALEGACVVCNFNDAMRSYGNFLQARVSQEIKREKDPFALMNIALHPESVFLYVPSHMQISTPIQVLNVISGQTTSPVVFPRLQVYLGQNSEISIASTTAAAQDSRHLCSHVCDVTLEKGAVCHLDEVALGLAKSWHFSALRAQLKKGAFFKAVRVSDGSETVRLSDSLELIEEEASCELSALGVLKGSEQHNHVLVEHKAPFCRSSQLFKHVLKAAPSEEGSAHKAKSSFEGKIYVHSEAQKTDAFQLSNNLILDDQSVAYAKPNLEIFADDVKASHGATTAEVDSDALFYLRSRGINKELAHTLLVKAFCSEIIDQIAAPTLKSWALEMLRFYDHRT